VAIDNYILILEQIIGAEKRGTINLAMYSAKRVALRHPGEVFPGF
jgi:hypothetical protein